jgi:hypothetical protein
MRILKNVVTLALTVAMAGGIGLGAFPQEAFAAGGVAINATNFPDKVFRTCVSKMCDKDKNGTLSQTEIKNVKDLEIDFENKYMVDDRLIESLKGIEFFTELKELSCWGNSISSLDLSKNVKLEELYCDENYLKSLDLSKNVNLKTLVVGDYFIGHGNGIKELDLSKNTKLEVVDCSYNGLKKLVLPKTGTLKELYCTYNKLEELDLTGCPNIKKLVCHKNNYTKVDISRCSKVKTVYLGQTVKDLTISCGQTVIMVENIKGRTITSDNKDILLVKNDYDSNKILDLIDTNTIADDGDYVEDSHYFYLKGKSAGETSITIIENKVKHRWKVNIRYKDVTNPSDFWFEPTYYLTKKDVVKGYDKQTTFKPSNECTRAQMVTFLWRLSGSPEPKSSKCKFADVKTGEYYYKAVIWAVEKGITTGSSGNKFNPNGTCTRAQTVTFLWRMADKPEPKAKSCKFKDVKSSDYFYKATIWASENKIVGGYSDGTFKPNDNCLRRQMVTFLYKYDKYINGNG